MQLGFGLSLTLPRGGASSFSPLSLFANGEQGAWFDASDLTAMYAISAPVSLVLDKSRGLLRGPDMKPTETVGTNGPNWTWDPVANRLTREVVEPVRDAFVFGAFPAATAVGEAFELACNVVSVSGSVRLGGSRLSPIGPVGVNDFSTTGHKSFVGAASVAGSGNFSVEPLVNPSVECVIDDITVRKIAGSHAWQGTSTARPTLMQSGAVPYLYRDPVDDALPWTAPAGSYDIVHIPLTGPATVLTAQSLSGAANILLAENTRAYLAIDRRLTGAEIDALAAYYGASA